MNLSVCNEKMKGHHFESSVLIENINDIKMKFGIRQRIQEFKCFCRNAILISVVLQIGYMELLIIFKIYVHYATQRAFAFGV